MRQSASYRQVFLPESCGQPLASNRTAVDRTGAKEFPSARGGFIATAKKKQTSLGSISASKSLRFGERRAPKLSIETSKVG